jgi:hypothetical protein
MSHVAVQVAFFDGYKQYWNDGRVLEVTPLPNHVAWCYRCCDDPRTDSWASAANPHARAAGELESFCAFHQDKVQKIHDRKLTAIMQITALMGAKISTLDLSSKAHGVEIIGVDLVEPRMQADDMVWVHYRCCDSQDHVERIHRLWHGADPKMPAPKIVTDVLNEIGQHRSNAALHHANNLSAARLRMINGI